MTVGYVTSNGNFINTLELSGGSRSNQALKWQVDYQRGLKGCAYWIWGEPMEHSPLKDRKHSEPFSLFHVMVRQIFPV